MNMDVDTENSEKPRGGRNKSSGVDEESCVTPTMLGKITHGNKNVIDSDTEKSPSKNLSRYATKGNSVGIARSDIPTKKSPNTGRGGKGAGVKAIASHSHGPKHNQGMGLSQSQVMSKPMSELRSQYNLNSPAGTPRHQIMQHSQSQPSMGSLMYNHLPYPVFGGPRQTVMNRPLTHFDINGRRMLHSAPELMGNCNRGLHHSPVEFMQTIGPSVKQLDDICANLDKHYQDQTKNDQINIDQSDKNQNLNVLDNEGLQSKLMCEVDQDGQADIKAGHVHDLASTGNLLQVQPYTAVTRTSSMPTTTITTTTSVFSSSVQSGMTQSWQGHAMTELTTTTTMTTVEENNNKRKKPDDEEKGGDVKRAPCRYAGQ